MEFEPNLLWVPIQYLFHEGVICTATWALIVAEFHERHFGVPSGTNSFTKRFAEAKVIADRIEKQMVPVSSIGAALGSNVTVEMER